MTEFAPQPHSEAGREVDEEIERDDRHPGDNAVRVRGSRSLTVLLIAGVIVGAVVWLIGAVVYWVRMIGTDLDPLSPANPGRWILWFQAAQSIGQALCVGSAAILIGLLVLRRWDDAAR